MKAVFASYDSGDDIGGVSSWQRRLLPRLQAAGITVEVHFLAHGGRPGANCAWFEKNGISFRWRPWETDTRRATRHCLDMLAESRPAIYVPNCLLPAYYAAGHARRQGVVTVGVLHSDDPFYWGIVDEFINGSADFRLSAVVAVSSFLHKAIEAPAKERGIAIRTIACGVPTPGETACAPGNVLRLVYTGRLVEEQKRISDVTRALCQAVFQDKHVEAWIIGDGPARADVERIIAEAGAGARVRLQGRVDMTKIYSMLEDCHAFVLLSDYEGLPVSMLEAMAVGVVPICLQMRSGISEVIRSGDNGLIVRDRGDDFLAAIKTLREDPALWSKLSAKARATVRDHFSDEHCVAAWLDLLHALNPGEETRTPAVRQPFFLGLPRPNPKFGSNDQRPSSPLSQNLNNLRNRAVFRLQRSLKN